jgi:endonuclease YncB( thermonuclease family)
VISHGLAYADGRFPHVFKHEFGERERMAKRSKAGLWAQVSPQQMPEWRQRMDTADAR